jgi:hypothetical protein
MSDELGPLEPFDDDVLSDVADDRGVATDRLRDLVVRHQERTREFPGLEELVYEWRSRLAYDPLVVRTDGAYYLALRGSVWADYGEQMGLTDDEVDLLREVHDRQVSRVAGARGERDAFEGAAPMLLTRP